MSDLQMPGCPWSSDNRLWMGEVVSVKLNSI